MTILIPAFLPDERLIRIVSALANRGLRVVVVDDGSGGAYKEVFDGARALGAFVLALEAHRGTGAALRAGFYFIRESGEPEGVVTADWTGEYKPEDILGMCAWTAAAPKNTMGLGVRRFYGHVPLHIRLGSFFARRIFAFALGHEMKDIQTALRGYPAHLLPWLLEVAGDGYNYLANVILEAPKSGVRMEQIPVATEWGETSAPWPAADTLASFWPLIKFALSGTLEAGVAYTILFFINAQTENLLFATVAARLASSGVNFTINKLLVFGTTAAHRTPRELLSYYIVYLILMLVNYLGLRIFYETLGLPIALSVVITEAAMFLISYTLQNRLVFGQKRSSGF